MSIAELQKAFKFPDVCWGTRVVFSNDASRSDRGLGEVIEVFPDSVTLLVRDSGGMRLRMDCIHIDDPRCVTNPDRFQPDEYGNSWTGVFELTDDEKRIRAVYDKLSGIEEYILRLEKRLTTRTALKE